MFVSRVTVDPQMLGDLDATIGCLVATDFGYPLADHAWNALDAHLYGFTLQELKFSFAEDEHAVGVDGVRRDAEALADRRAESRGIEDRARADDTTRREARQALRDVGHHVDRIGGDQQDRLGHGLRDLADDGAEDLGVPAEQLRPALSRLLADAGGDRDDGGAGEVAVIAGTDRDRGGEGRRVRDVLGMRAGALRILIDEDDLGSMPRSAMA